MSDGSAIEWTDATWNPVRGCDKVSPGCKHCYAETFAERWRGIKGHPFEQGFDLRLVPEALGKPLAWKSPRRIFVNSMSDLFHAAVPDDYIAAAFDVIASCPQHTFQVLTKRAERMREFMASRSPLRNVWLGVSVENADYLSRVECLLETRSVVRFLSIEPLLGPVTLHPGTLGCIGDLAETFGNPLIHWVIVGGESGACAREMKPDWVRAIRDQVVESGAAFFFKQWGGVRKKLAGRELDGRTWDEYPTVTQ